MQSLVTAEKIKEHGWIFAEAGFGKRPYRVLDVVRKRQGFEIKTQYRTATFTLCINNVIGSNWRFATQEDFKPCDELTHLLVTDTDNVSRMAV